MLQRIEILNTDALELLKEYDKPDAVFYLDPPHLGYNYYKYNFTLERYGWKTTVIETMSQTKKKHIKYHFLHNYTIHKPRQQVLERYITIDGTL